MISFPVILINTISILMICAVFVIAWRSHADTCAKQLVIVTVFMLIWAIGSFLEMGLSGLSQKILWRNVTQIGVFGTPPSILIFSIAYTSYFKKSIGKISAVAYSIQSVAVLFILTDHWHHLARAGISIVRGSNYETLIVQTTVINRVFISFNFVYMAASLAILTAFLFSPNAKTMKKQALCLITGILISVIYSLIKISSNEMFGIMVPISGIFALADLCMLFGIFRFDLLMLAPLARNQVFNIVDDGIIISTGSGKIVDFNRAAKAIFSQCIDVNETESAAKCIERQIAELFPDWYNALAINQTERFEFSVDGEVQKYYLCELYPVYSKQTFIGSISVIKDITQQKKSTDLLKLRAERDGLTGIFNRKTFIDHVDGILNEYDGDVCLVYMDIDYFKDINDKYGHIFGDDVLVEVCKLIQAQLKEDEFIGRMGGEEFAVFRRAAGEGDSLCFAEDLRRIISEHEFMYYGTSVRFTISAGIAVGRFGSFDALYRIADMNLYKAKQAGRNKVFGN